MIKHNQDGAVSGVAISLVLCVLLLLAAIGFGAWSFTSRQDYKNNSDQKAAVAADAAVKQEDIKKDKQFAEDYKKPLKTYDGPDATGSLHINFPKTWSGYVVDSVSSGSSATMDAYFAPGVVPAKDDANSVFALRVQLVGQSYADVVKNLSSLQAQGKISVKAYALPKLPKITGVEVTGQVTNQKDVTMVILPLRSQTLQIWTEGSQYIDDFNNNILPNFSFAP
jgi:hypothetical protein